MSDDKMKVEIDLDVKAQGEELVDALSKKLKALNNQITAINRSIKAAASAVTSSGRSPTGTTATTNAAKAARSALMFDREATRELKTRMAVQGRMAAQRSREERSAFGDFKSRVSFKELYEANALKAVRQQIATTTRMNRQRQSEETATARAAQRSIADTTRMEQRRMRDAAAAITANARLETSELRRVERDHRRIETARNRGLSSLRSGYSDARIGAGRAVTVAGTSSLVAGAATGALVRKGISSRMEVDSAETNLKIFSGQSQAQIKAARKGWLDNASIRSGLGIAGGIDAYGEVLKAGLKSPIANTKSIMAGVSALELNLKDTTKLAGLIDRNYGANSTPAKIKSALNAIAVAAREDPTNAPEIVEGMKRGFGVLSMGNMSPEDLAAFVSGGQSVGIQPGKAGTFIATLGKQLSSGANRFLGKKNREELNFAASKLGFGNAKSMANAFQSDSSGTIFKVLEGLKAADAQTRTTIAGALSGNQWNDEDLQIVNGLDGLKSTYAAVHDSKNSGFLDEAAAQRQASWLGMWNSTKSIFGRFWDAFGSGFDQILTDINKYFLEINTKFDFDQVRQYVVDFLDGVKDALGVKTWRELLQNTFGGGIGGYGPQVREFARGFTEGLLAIGRAIRAVVTAFSGSNASASEMGKWTGGFIALTAALMVCAPAIALLNGIGVALMGFATVALGAWKILRAAGLVGTAAAGTATKVPTVPGSGASRLLGRFGLGGAAGFAATSGLSKSESNALSLRLGKWAQERESKADSKPWIDPPAKKAVEDLKDAIDANTLIQNQSFDSENGFSGLIHKASISTTGAADAVRSSLTGSGSSVRSAVLSGSLSGGGGLGGGLGPLGDSVPGSALNGGGGLSRRGIIGGVGRGGGGGSSGVGASDNSPIAPHRGKTFDSIAPRMMADLQKDFGITKEQAAGIAGNLGHESAGMTAFQEGNPRGGGRGGWGYAQWTGPRRRQFEAYAASKGLDPKSYEANYGFLRHELQTSEKGGINAVKRQSTVEGSTMAFERSFERAGVKHDSSRLKWARRAAGLPDGVAGVAGPGADIAKAEAMKSSGWKAGMGGSITDKADAIKAGGWKPGGGGNAGALGNATPSLGSDAPVRPMNTMPIGGGGGIGGGKGGSSSSINAPIHINGQGMDANAIANAVQRKLSEQMNRRTNDISPYSI